MRSAGRIRRCEAHYRFSGLTKCGTRGAGFIVWSKSGSAASVPAIGDAPTTTWPRVRRVETRVVGGLRDELFRHDLFEKFHDEFTREMNR